MSLNITNFKNINYFFGDAIEKMKDDPINHCLKKNVEWALRRFDLMLRCLAIKSNVKELIDEYKKNQLNDQNRIYSLISEIRAGFSLSKMNFSVEYLKEGNKKTPDMK